MAAKTNRVDPNDPIIRHVSKNFTSIPATQTVRGALDWLRAHPPSERIIYFYVVDDDGRLQGVVPTRRLVLSPPDTPIAEIMACNVVALPAEATVLDACEFFIQHRFLAFPVVDAERRIIGVVDIELYTEKIVDLAPLAPVRQLIEPLTRFLQIESASGVALLICTVVALFAANSSWANAYAAFWQTQVGVTLGALEFQKPLVEWINDGLMTLFFFVMGLEIKSELLFGELNSRAKAMLPIVAAGGGMIAPAVIYLTVIAGRGSLAGWGIPMATDIAFVVGFLALFGDRVPRSLRVALLALAIVDDIGATLVIALAYSHDFSALALALSAGGFGMIALFRWLGVRRLAVYVILGTLTWFAVLESGIHPTIAGVALGLMTPARSWLGDRMPIDVVTDLLRRVGGRHGDDLRAPSEEPISPLERAETALHPWVAFGIMPIFALANAGVVIDFAAVTKPMTVAVALGLLIGKPLGILGFGWLAVRFGWARAPKEFGVPVMFAAGCLAGIGFTMSLFIAGLALHGPELEEAKLGILCGSALSAVVGCALLWRFLPRNPAVAT
jgi:NhaA family Na+:H+ antiporter